MPSPTLESTARALVAPGKGILAADESFPTIEKRFTALSIPSNEENRRAYREMLFTTPKLSDFISGVILFDETLRQKTSDGVAFPSYLSRHGIMPGIKVDLGTVALPNSAEEKITQGLDGLRERLQEYRELGARFTKWRAVLLIGKSDLPSRACLAANAQKLALFAALSQEAGMVPIVEPEVLMDGDHSLDRCEEVTATALQTVFAALHDHQVKLEAMLLKPAMVLPGSERTRLVPDEDIALRTLRCLRRNVPAAVPGIVFLSGGQNPTQATQRLTAITRAHAGPWALTFSFGRALQENALKLWRGKPDNVGSAQTVLLERARQNSIAVKAPTKKM